MGRAERRQALHALDCAHQPACGCGHRCPPAELADGSCHLLRGLLQEMAEGDVERIPAHGCALVCHAGSYPLGHYPRHCEPRFGLRRLLRQHAGSAVQQWNHLLLCPAGCTGGVGLVVLAEEETSCAQCRHHEFRYVGHRLQHLLYSRHSCQHQYATQRECAEGCRGYACLPRS